MLGHTMTTVEEVAVVCALAPSSPQRVGLRTPGVHLRAQEGVA